MRASAATIFKTLSSSVSHKGVRSRSLEDNFVGNQNDSRMEGVR